MLRSSMRGRRDPCGCRWLEEPRSDSVGQGQKWSRNGSTSQAAGRILVRGSDGLRFRSCGSCSVGGWMCGKYTAGFDNQLRCIDPRFFCKSDRLAQPNADAHRIARSGAACMQGRNVAQCGPVDEPGSRAQRRQSPDSGWVRQERANGLNGVVRPGHRQVRSVWFHVRCQVRLCCDPAW